MPPKDRWRCTFELSQNLPGIKCRLLDDLLEYFGKERRDPDEAHESVKDCQLAATVYMEIMKMPKAYAKDLGFVNEKDIN